jgi:hypothetical protein
MTHVEIYEEPKPIEMTPLRTALFSLAHIATKGMNYISLICELPGPAILIAVGVFLLLCNQPPTYPTPAAIIAVLLWWFLVMTIGRYVLRGIVAWALMFEIYQLLASNWHLLSPLKA